ncbi:uncharacterized protein LOC143353710 isoform X2 [Halictus rubicundus]|uniref:uncharacterized protein LOC143353710 isoform X2 n=1 Tax=Halictus rubicundus TaxID=77578 RepID=UPI00403508F2
MASPTPEVLSFVLQPDHFCYSEPMCKAVHLFEDVPSIRSCLNIILNKMHEMLSFCALRDGSQEIVGVLIASHLDRNQGELKFKPSQGDALYQIAKLKYYAITEAQFYETVDAEKLIHIDVLCVNPRNQNEGIGTALVRSCVDRATKINSGCVGEFSSDAARTIAVRLGFEIHSEIPYEFMGWLNRKFEIFETCRAKNYSLVCTAFVPPVPRIPSVVISPSTVTKASSRRQRKTNDKKKKVKK